MNFEIFLMYCIVSFFYIISPGPAVFLAISNGMTTNSRIVAISSLGNIVGLSLLSTISILGLGALLVTSSIVFMIVKVIGASYLIFLGIKQFKITKSQSVLPDRVESQRLKKDSAYFYEGFFLASTNPKPILFFTAIFPQFLNVENPVLPQFIVMTITFMSISFLSLFSYGYISKSAKKIFSNETGMAWFHRVTGGLFIGMGVGLLQLKNSQS